MRHYLMNNLFWIITVTISSSTSYTTSIKANKPTTIMQSSSTTIKPSNKHDLKRTLPPKLIIGYTKKVEPKVLQAVKDGVNVIIWSFLHIVSKNHKATIIGGPPLHEIHEFKLQLQELGYENVVHLTSFGGWNEIHLPDDLTAQEMYQAFKEYDTLNVYDGFDWDLEGNDNVQSDRNVLSITCLQNMGLMSQYAHEDGYIVAMAPAESYLDVSTSDFSRYLNLTYPLDDWQLDFRYHGRNAYAYLLAEFSDCFDIISIQLYESYTHAGYNITQLGASPVEYLLNYIESFRSPEGKEGFVVNFQEGDSELQIPNQFVNVPLKKLVIGLANGWADGVKHIYFAPKDLEQVYDSLKMRNLDILGFMFWCIESEGTKGIHLAKGLNRILKTRNDGEEEEL